MDTKTIPIRLKDIADKLGLNTIEFVKRDSKYGDIFSLSMKDETGEYIPIGQPILYCVNGSSVTEIINADDILSTLKDE